LMKRLAPEATVFSVGNSEGVKAFTEAMPTMLKNSSAGS